MLSSPTLAHRCCARSLPSPLLRPAIMADRQPPVHSAPLVQPAPCRRSVSSPLDNDHITTRAVLRSFFQTRTCARCCQSGGVERDDAAAAVRCHSARRDSADAQPTSVRFSLRRCSQDKRASLEADLAVGGRAAPPRAPVRVCSRCRIVCEVRPSSRRLHCLSSELHQRQSALMDRPKAMRWQRPTRPPMQLLTHASFGLPTAISRTHISRSLRLTPLQCHCDSRLSIRFGCSLTHSSRLRH